MSGSTASCMECMAPVADVVPASMGRRNEPIGALRRGYGANPTTVAGKVTSFIDGMQTAGVATSAKHLPGIGRVGGPTGFPPDAFSTAAPHGPAPTSSGPAICVGGRSSCSRARNPKTSPATNR